MEKQAKILNLLALNSGSSSQKCSLFQLPEHLSDEPLDPVWKAEIQGTAPSLKKGQALLRISIRGKEAVQETIRRKEAKPEKLRHLLEKLWTGPAAILGGPEEIGAVAHRVVHGGDRFSGPALLDRKTEKAIEKYAEFAPLHNPVSLAAIRASRKMFGTATRQLAVFDTAFHRTLPEAAALYGGPYEWWRQGIRRYGFHGTSFAWAQHRAEQLLERRKDPELKLILCHLGGGCSLCATAGGRSLDTTMGFTPLDGLTMTTRSGSLDPGILLYLMKKGWKEPDLEKLLNRESGMKGISGRSGDTRVLTERARKGDGRARLALEVFAHSLCAGLGRMLAALKGKPDAIVFTDAIAEDEPDIRKEVCERFAFLGIRLDPARNRKTVWEEDGDGEISKPGKSDVRVLVIHSREDWEMARQCHGVLAGKPGL